LAVTLKFEGGKSANPNDPGGNTMMGITQATYTANRAEHGLPPADVFQITPSEVASIYYARYWKPCAAESFVWPLDVIIFDTAVNSGVGRATEFLGYTHDPATFLAWRLTFVRWLASPHSLLPKELLRAGKARTFLKGWEKRISTLQQIAGITSIPSL